MRLRRTAGLFVEESGSALASDGETVGRTSRMSGSRFILAPRRRIVSRGPEGGRRAGRVRWGDELRAAAAHVAPQGDQRNGITRGHGFDPLSSINSSNNLARP
jgi:hypothetical protein